MHFLDELFNPMTVSANGVLLPKKQIIEFDETFELEVTDDRILIRGTGGEGGGVTTLDGNVTGAPDDNIVEVITGDGEGDVLVEATSFSWDLDVSAGEAELTVAGDNGAIHLKHESKEVLAALGSAPRFGNTTSIAQLRGGMRFSRRLVASNVTLDTTTTDLLVHVNASGERQITLPPPSDGRTILFMIAGPSTVTIRRSGTELINGVAGNYVVPFQNATVIVTSDGPNWHARSFGDIPAITLAGDAVGLPDANTVQRITGNGSGQVAMGASSLLWDNAVSSGNAEVKISSSDAGAVALRHNSTDVLVAASAGARLGTSTGTNRLLGGARFARRTVTTPSVVLDSGSSDMLVHVDASAARLITLPAVADGRTIVFMILGASTVTIARSAFESINGAAGDFVVPFPNALVVATCDGTNWIARAFGDPVTLSTTAPLTGGGSLSSNRTIALDPAGYVAPGRTISTTAPLTGGGDLSANRTLGIDPAGYVAPSRTISVTAPLTGGGDLSTNRTIGLDTSGFVGVARVINTTAPLTGGGALSGDLTLAVAGASIDGMGVVQLAGNLAGTAAAPLVAGLRADSISIQNADATHKAVWKAAGLRIGDNTTPTEKLEVVGNVLATAATAKITGRNTNAASDLTTADPAIVAEASPSNGNAIVMGIVNAIRRGGVRWDSSGNANYNAVGSHYFFSGLTTGTPLGNWSTVGLRVGDTTTATAKLDVVGSGVASGDFIANNGAGGKARIAGLVGSPTTHGALYLGNVTPSATNYTIASNGGNDTKINAGSGGTITGVINGATKFTFSDANVNNIGTFTQNIQITGGQLWTTRTVSADYSIDSSTKDCVLFVDTSGGARLITLPSPANGRVITVKRIAGGNNVTVNKGTATKIDINAGISVLLAQTDVSQIHPYVKLACDGTNWYIVASLSATIQTS